MAYSLVLTTCPSLASAQKVARSLVRAQLAACVQITGNVKSFYTWKGKPTTAKEVQVWIKTKKSLVKKIEKEISRIHPYEVPEILSIDISQGLKSYLNWIDQETRGH